MVFGRSRSLRSKRSGLRPSDEAVVPAATHPGVTSTNAKPSCDLNVLRTSMMFPEGPQNTVPKIATTYDDMHLFRSSLLFPGESTDVSVYRPTSTAERPETADDTSSATAIEKFEFGQDFSQPLTSPEHREFPLVKNGDGTEMENMVIGMALGDPDEDLALFTEEQIIVNHGPPSLEDPSPTSSLNQDFVDAKEQLTRSSSPTPMPEPEKKSELPSTEKHDSLNHNSLFSEQPSTTSSSPMPQSERPFVARETREANNSPPRKPSRWHVLGGWFGKKNIPPATSPAQFYRMQQETKSDPPQGAKLVFDCSPLAPKTNASTKAESLGLVPKGKDRDNRNRSSSARLTKTKGGTRPAFKRIRTAPPLQPQEHGPIPPPKDPDPDKASRNLQADCQPFLSVDIPDIQLDRYSVMFGGLLEPKPQPSLLVRRQGHLEDVKIDSSKLEDEDLRKHQRRATSPSYVKSPLFSLFPPTPTQATRTLPTTKQSSKPSPLHRSNTTPGALSPNRSNFESTGPTDQSGPFARTYSSARTEASEDLVLNGSPDVPTQPMRDNTSQQIPFCHDKSQQPPQRDHPTHIPETTSDPAPDPALTLPSLVKTAPESTPISLARQISITRRQRHLLPATDSASAERLVNRQPLTPTLVDVRSGSQGHMVRQPQRGLIESA